jgi:hypothetical protein
MIWGTGDPYFPIQWAHWLMERIAAPQMLHIIHGAKLYMHFDFVVQQVCNPLARRIVCSGHSRLTASFATRGSGVQIPSAPRIALVRDLSGL